MVMVHPEGQGGFAVAWPARAAAVPWHSRGRQVLLSQCLLWFRCELEGDIPMLCGCWEKQRGGRASWCSVTVPWLALVLHHHTGVF